MPPKLAAAAGKPKAKKAVSAPKPPPVQSAGPGMMFSRESFFLPKRGPDGGKVAIPVKAENAAAPGDSRFFSRSSFQQQRHFVRDKVTGEPYAEWVNGVAVCIHTGQELFRSRRCYQEGGNSTGQYGDDESFGGAGGCAAARPFDYSVPKQRHPNDYSVSTDEILASGFITEDDFKAPDGAAIRLADYEAYVAAAEQRRASAV
jgi:hypothetical protein